MVCSKDIFMLKNNMAPTRKMILDEGIWIFNLLFMSTFRSSNVFGKNHTIMKNRGSKGKRVMSIILFGKKPLNLMNSDCSESARDRERSNPLKPSIDFKIWKASSTLWLRKNTHAKVTKKKVINRKIQVLTTEVSFFFPVLLTAR